MVFPEQVKAGFRNHRGEMDRFTALPPVGGAFAVIASGPSARGPWPEKPNCTVIAVNGAVEGLPWAPDYWFTIDPSPDNMRRLASLTPETKPVMAVDPDYGPNAREAKYRQDFGRAHLLCLKRSGEVKDDLRMLTFGNSGRAAVNLAMHLGATKIGVFGVDGTTHAHWFDPTKKSGNLTTLGEGCALLQKPGVDIVFADVGVSKVQGQKKARPEAVLAWLTRP